MTGTSSTRYSVVYLSSIDWDFRRQDHQFISLELASRGHRVLFIENTGARIPALRDLSRVAARLRNWASTAAAPHREAGGSIEVASPLVIPGGSSLPERLLNNWLLGAQLRGALARLGPERRVLWIGLPTWTAVDLIRLVRPEFVAYYCGDAFAEIPGIRQGLVESERQVVRRADLVFANSAELVRHCLALGARDPIRVPIGIDLTASESARRGEARIPDELRGLRGRLIGYMGGLNHKVDVALLEAVAKEFSDDTVVILGSIEDPRYRPRGATNVVILGERPYDEIGPYLVRFAVGLIPYVLNEFTASVYPGKLLEYLALGRPVVSTPLPEVIPYASVVRIASGPDAFVAAVRDALAEPDTQAVRDERVRWAARNSYERIVVDMVSRVDRGLGGSHDR